MSRRGSQRPAGSADGLGAKIRDRRRVIGLTQAELAKAIDVSPQQLQKYETGRNAVSIERLPRICEALKLPLDFFAHSSSTADLIGKPATAGDQAPAFEHREAVEAFLASAEGNRLVRSFMAVDDRMLRTQILDFVASLDPKRSA